MWFESDLPAFRPYDPEQGRSILEPEYPVLRNDMNAFEDGSEFAFGRNNFQGRVDQQLMSDLSWIHDPFSPLETLVVQPVGEKSTRVVEEDIVVTGYRTYRLDTYS